MNRTAGLVLAVLLASCQKPVEETREDALVTLYKQQINAYIDQVAGELGALGGVKDNLTLPAGAGGITVVWESANSSALGNNGTVTRPSVGSGDARVELTGVFSKGGVSISKTFIVTILAQFDDAASVAAAKAALAIETFMNYYYSDITLPAGGEEGTAITWTSGSADYPVTANRVRVRDTVDGTVTFKLTAAIAKGSASDTREFTVTARENRYYGYLFAYFNGNDISQEQVRYALSTDGLNYTALNNDEAVISSAEIAATGGVRDPFIMRGADGTFYMSVTDMKSSLGWASNRGIVLLKSTDLINWEYGRINIATSFPERFGDINSAWAPEIVYDRKTGK